MTAPWKLWYVAPVPDGRMTAFAARLGLLRHPDFPGRPGPVVRDVRDASELLRHLGYADQEHSVVISLDADDRLLAIHEPGIGSAVMVMSDARDIVKVPLLVGARSIYFAHNHPSGLPRPSEADLDMNRYVNRLALGLGIELRAAIVVGRSGRFTYDEEFAPPRLQRNPGRPRERARMGRQFGSAEQYACRTVIVRSRSYDVDSAPQVTSSLDAAALLEEHVHDHNIVMIGMDAHDRVVAVHEAEDTPDAFRQLAEVALASVSLTCIVAQRLHDGASDDDRILQMSDAMMLVGVRLLDYVFCTPDGQHVSALATEHLDATDMHYRLPIDEQRGETAVYEVA